MADREIAVTEDMLIAGVSELISFDSESGDLHEAADRIYRSMEGTRIDSQSPEDPREAEVYPQRHG